jgi:outer membrane protein assembly factor BamB
VLTLAQVDSGERILQRELEPTSLVARVGRLVVVTEGRTVLGIDAVGGQQRWTHTLTADPAGVLGSPAGVVVVTHNTLEGLDAETGVLRWSRPTEGQVAPVTLDTVLCYAEAGNLYGLEAATGKEKWQQHLPGMLNAPVLTHDIVYVHTEGGTLHALSTFDGQVLWQLDVGPPSRQVVANSERMVWVATNEIRGVDLVKKQLLKPVRIDYLRPLPEDVGIPVIRTPLTLDGTWLFGAERGRRLFMARLEE